MNPEQPQRSFSTRPPQSPAPQVLHQEAAADGVAAASSNDEEQAEMDEGLIHDSNSRLIHGRDKLQSSEDADLKDFVQAHENELKFPEKLMLMLSDVEKEYKIDPPISWTPDGQAFAIYDRTKFTDDVLPFFFGPAKYASFVRKLNRWGFRKVVVPEQRANKSKDIIGYGHSYFKRDKKHLMYKMKNSALAHLKGVENEKAKQELLETKSNGKRPASFGHKRDAAAKVQRVKTLPTNEAFQKVISAARLLQPSGAPQGGPNVHGTHSIGQIPIVSRPPSHPQSQGTATMGAVERLCLQNAQQAQRQPRLQDPGVSRPPSHPQNQGTVTLSAIEQLCLQQAQRQPRLQDSRISRPPSHPQSQGSTAPSAIEQLRLQNAQQAQRQPRLQDPGVSRPPSHPQSQGTSTMSAIVRLLQQNAQQAQRQPRLQDSGVSRPPTHPQSQGTTAPSAIVRLLPQNAQQVQLQPRLQDFGVSRPPSHPQSQGTATLGAIEWLRLQNAQQAQRQPRLQIAQQNEMGNNHYGVRNANHGDHIVPHPGSSMQNPNSHNGLSGSVVFGPSQGLTSLPRAQMQHQQQVVIGNDPVGFPADWGHGSTIAGNSSLFPTPNAMSDASVQPVSNPPVVVVYMYYNNEGTPIPANATQNQQLMHRPETMNMPNDALPIALFPNQEGIPLQPAPAQHGRQNFIVRHVVHPESATLTNIQMQRFAQDIAYGVNQVYPGVGRNNVLQGTNPR